ncbi:MAG TPA: hypothetical protein VF053_03680, partial [Streptosporangiales bacterium]
MTVAGRFVDFYALLSIPPDAPAESVGEAIAEQRRRWEASTASTAEERVRELDLAELVLLDPEQRADYDDEWRSRTDGRAPEAAGSDPRPEPEAAPAAEAPAEGPAEPPAVPDGGDGRSGDAWAEQAREA